MIYAQVKGLESLCMCNKNNFLNLDSEIAVEYQVSLYSKIRPRYLMSNIQPETIYKPIRSAFKLGTR